MVPVGTSSPPGPFVDDSSSAFVCPVSMGGAIAPSVFIRADGTPWLLWKSDGDCCDLSTTIYSQQLAPDGLSVVGPPHKLIGSSQPWEGNLVEAPSMIRSGPTYRLFYSANLWDTPTTASASPVASQSPAPAPSRSTMRGWPRPTPDPAVRSSSRLTDSSGWCTTRWRPGRPANSAQRRLYVDLLAFPSGQPPRIGPRCARRGIGRGRPVLQRHGPPLPTRSGVSRTRP